jgi:hypothetical protein
MKLRGEESEVSELAGRMNGRECAGGDGKIRNHLDFSDPAKPR